jgi:hypothetical protein
MIPNTQAYGDYETQYIANRYLYERKIISIPPI